MKSFFNRDEEEVEDYIEEEEDLDIINLDETAGWSRLDVAEEMAKQKAIQALSNSAYECLKAANQDFEDYLDSMIGTALFDIKNK